MNEIKNIYDKEYMSKIELTQKLIETLSKPENKGDVLADSWYIVVRIFLMLLKKLTIVILVF